MATETFRAGKARLFRQILLLAAGYALLGWLTRLPAGGTESLAFAATAWPSAGIALGALLVRGTRLWPGIWIGAFLVTFAYLPETLSTLAAIVAAGAIAIGATLQALAGRALARRALGGSLAFDTGSAVLRFILLCGALASLIGATIGTGVLLFFDAPHTTGLFSAWLTWWTADTLGVLLVTPIVLSQWGRPRAIWRPRRLTVAMPLLFAAVVTVLAFSAIERFEEDNHRTEFGVRAPPTAIAETGDALGHHALHVWAIRGGGLAVVALLSAFLLTISGHAARTEQLVAARTAELEQARAEAEKQGQLLREAVASIAQGFTIYDENDRLVICNDAYKKFYAASADLIVPGTRFGEIIRKGAERGQYPSAIGRVDDWVAERIEIHQRADGKVVEQRLNDGRWLLIVEHRTPSGYIVGNRIDITDLKQTASALADRNAQLDTIFRLSPDGLVLIDHEGRVKFANPAFLRMSGLLASDFVGQPVAELERRLRECAENPDAWPGLTACISAQKPGAGDTAPRQLLALARPRNAVLDFVCVASDAASIGQLLYVRDVTHEVEVDRMKSEFLSHAAHELRTPMASIYGFTELLMSQEFDAETRKDLLGTIHKQTAWLVEIINELLDLARIESRRGKDFRIEAVPVAPLLDEIVAALKVDPGRWPLAIAIPADLPPARADAAKLRQALTNVLGNAVKYSPQGGAIEVACAVRDGARPMIAITVTDHGIGMTPEQAARVCERFYRADTSGNIPGTGLGMTIVKEIAELLGGSLSISSSPNSGSAVSILVPAAIHNDNSPPPQGDEHEA